MSHHGNFAMPPPAPIHNSSPQQSPDRRLLSPPTTPSRSAGRLFSSPPVSDKRELYSDRFIPSRITTNLEEALDILDSKSQQRDAAVDHSFDNQTLMNNLLRSELLGQYDSPDRRSGSLEGNFASPPRKESSISCSSILRYRSSTSSVASTTDTSLLSTDMTSPAKRNLSTPTKPTRKIPKTPFKILDAPFLQDDYYLNLVDWGPHNILAVALGGAVFLWSTYTSKSTKLLELPGDELVTSVCWAPLTAGCILAVGCSTGQVTLWDCSTRKMVRELKGHESRVGCLAWGMGLLASGSRDRNIYLQDIRIRSPRGHSLGSVTSPSSSSSSSVTIPSSSGPSGLSASPIAMEGLDSSRTASPGGTVPLGTDNLSASISSGLGMPIFRQGALRLDAAGASLLSAGVENVPPPSTSGSVVRLLSAHRQEVCGLKWSFDNHYLASGGNDNKLYVWDVQAGSAFSGGGASSNRLQPLHRFEDHIAAVKAVAWSPHHHHLLASGGGTADRHIRFWNTASGEALHKIDTSSQVCNLLWSKNSPELVSTHGYSLNQVNIWKYPSMQKMATLTGHTFRVLYLAMSPDGQTIVTGAGDETLRFWSVFPGPRNKAGLLSGQSSLAPSPSDAR